MRYFYLLSTLLIYTLLNMELLAQVSIYEFEEIIVNTTGDADVSDFVEYNDILLFSAKDNNEYRQLWSTDGTLAGTEKLTAISAINGVNLRTHQIYNNKFYFTGITVGETPQLWSTDGTLAGTQMEVQIPSGELNDFYIFKDVIYFDYNHFLATYDMTTGEFVALPHYYSPEASFLEHNDRLYFRFSQLGPPGKKVMSLTTNLSDTIRLDIDNILSSRLFAFNDDLIFIGTQGENDGLLSYTPSTNSYTEIKSSISSYGSLKIFNNELFFLANDGITGNELWKSDGTPAGTMLVKDINEGSSDSSPNIFSSIISTDNELYFPAKTNTTGHEIWKTDGTEAGTKLAVETITGANPTTGAGFFTTSPQSLANYDGMIFFVAYESEENVQLFATSGIDGHLARFTPDSTAMTDVISEYSKYDKTFTKDGSLYVGARMSSNGSQLWKLTSKDLVNTSFIENTSFSIYPNPTADMIYINSDQHHTFSYTISDTNGQLIKKGQINGSDSYINIQELQAKGYFLTIETPHSNDRKSFFIVKQ